MKKTLLLGIAIASAFIIGTLSANPVADAMAGWKFALDEHQRDSSAHNVDGLDARVTTLENQPSGTPLYHKTTTFQATFGVETAYEDFCDAGDTIITGYITDFIPPTNNDFNVGSLFAIKTATQEGFRILFVNDNGPTQDAEGVIVCADSNP